MTASRILEAALEHFAESGYEGAALSDIARQVGIRTPSIYAHFKNKDDLFLSVIDKAVADQLERLRDYFAQQGERKPIGDQLYGLIIDYEERYQNDSRVKFLLRMMFFPPPPLLDPVMERVNGYLDEMERLLAEVCEQGMARGQLAKLEVHTVTSAFMCLLDGVLVEMLLGGPVRFKKRLEASWTMFRRSIAP
ncbi:MAG: TetR/AcrR family transcriptional regulator [Paenibacillus dendritiformis]|uniref:TetR/AcrR family transcriptional regulator n=1 Tax=Paenibacillus dendritiformis TaxID=130049 RepID=UPI00143D1909|nr:TetR/AcrR family transcriptional regulator [Paenibacillus dendritiformis]MDU5144306.1 TetR/AcrR family transcriptional regulator [Paenibacillus dendritiformis]NKI22148.1 TetR/AcrR family transcriptional regulator [Paenibacillus dendritiformis]NRF98059.1 TetR/AcrR family transcriptional regulator [Paenibacillus dendritiformis]GIO73467.1 TetR family transcriptional regulator [Paenibacillus dendritiformis]